MEKSPNDDRDLLAKNIYNSRLRVPKNLDLRKKMNNVRNQGETAKCGAFSGASIKEWQENQDLGFSGYFSPDYIYNKRSNKEESGMYARDVMKILHKYGTLPDISFQDSAMDDMMATNFKIKGYAQVETIEECKKALYKDGPCLISLPMYNKESLRMWDPKEGDGKSGHAMIIVGYNDTGFIIRNSFGEKWGADGYCVYPYDDWGSHWEIWTCFDEKSSELPRRIMCLGKIGSCFGT